MRQPWFKFFPSDWRGDPKLRACSLGARGLLAECLALMHEAIPYGHLLINGTSPSDKELAGQVNATTKQVTRLKAELLARNVLDEVEGVLVSRKMVRASEQRANDTDRQRRHRETRRDRGVTDTVTDVRDTRVTKAVTKAVTLARARVPEARSQKPDVQVSSTPGTADTSPVRAFLMWFQAEYTKHRAGAAYFVAWSTHAPMVARLLKLHPPERLRKHAKILLTTDDEWIAGTDRGVEILVKKINWLEGKLAAWERVQGGAT